MLQGLIEDAPTGLKPSDAHSGALPSVDPLHGDNKSTVPVSEHEKSARQIEENVRATLSPYIMATGTHSPPRDDMSRASSEGPSRSLDMRRSRPQSMETGRLAFEGSGRRSLSRSRHPGRSQIRASSRSRIRSLSATRNTLREEGQFSEVQASSESYVHSMGDPASIAAIASGSDETQASASQILKGSDVFRAPTIQTAGNTHQAHGAGEEHATAAKNIDSTTEDTQRLTVKGRPDPHRGNTVETVGSSNGGAESTTGSVPGLQTIVKVGSYPLQRAAGLVGYVNKHSKRMSSLLATESMGYVEKVSGMWKGGKKHYDDQPGLAEDEGICEDDDESSGDRFRDHFALPSSEKLQAAYFGYLHRVLPLYGKIYISDRSFCFRSLLPGTRTKLILPLKDVETVDKEKGFRFGYSGLVVVIRGHEELFFEFAKLEARDDCAVTILQILEVTRYLKSPETQTPEERESAENASAEHRALLEARARVAAKQDIKPLHSTEELRDAQSPILFDDPRASFLTFKPTESLRITCLTIGTRGDVQPYIALCKGLLAEGHRPRIATHFEYKEWIESHGIAFTRVEGDPAELMRICVEHGMFTYSFLREASSRFRGWIDELLSTSWLACQDSDVLIESPSAMGGIHIAEALRIPYFRAFSMPWTRTRAYPHAFAVPDYKMGGAYNYITYVMFDNVFWKATAGQINRWRKSQLGLGVTSLEKMQPNKVPFLYNYSPSFIVPPLDYSDWIRVTGYWFLDEGTQWTPPEELTDFIKKAREDGKKLVYVGFGSIVVQDSAALTNTVIKSVLRADVRCILSKGWSDRLDRKDASVAETPLPAEIHQIKSAPHDWLFSQVDAVAHHGGAGTTGASLRAGLPTIIKPFFGDQFFFGSRVEDLGVGIILKKLNVSVFARALWEATHSERMIVKARVLGEQIRKVCPVSLALEQTILS